MLSDSNILVISGEVSGDLHGAPVVKEIRKLNPEILFWGTGGSGLSRASVNLVAHIDDMAVMGFSGVPRLLPRLGRLKKELLRQIVKRKTRLVLLVDYPGFNLNFAKALRRLTDPPRVLYYIAPQVWAWRSGRIDKMRSIIDRLAVVFPFEYNLFRDRGVNVVFVGHPLLDELDKFMDDTEELGAIRNNKNERLLALLPGSRLQEIQRHLPVMLKASASLKKRIPDLKVEIGKAPNLAEKLYKDLILNASKILDLSVVERDWVSIDPDSRSLVKRADIAAVCSGTATLETALLDTPQVVLYKTSRLNYTIARRVVKLQNIALVNIVAGRRIVPELVQSELTAEKLERELAALLSDKSRCSRMSREYNEIKISLGTPGAAGRVAELAVEMLDD